jgi:hypothetical protein
MQFVQLIDLPDFHKVKRLTKQDLGYAPDSAGEEVFEHAFQAALVWDLMFDMRLRHFALALSLPNAVFTLPSSYRRKHKPYGGAVARLPEKCSHLALSNLQQTQRSIPRFS